MVGPTRLTETLLKLNQVRSTSGIKLCIYIHTHIEQTGKIEQFQHII